MAATILIAEDDRSLQKILGIVVSRLKLESTSVSDGQAVLDELAKGGYDLVLLDLLMPKVDGLEVLRQMRERGDKTPVIVLSNLDSDDDIATAKKFGAKQYIIKSNISLVYIREVIAATLAGN